MYADRPLDDRTVRLIHRLRVLVRLDERIKGQIDWINEICYQASKADDDLILANCDSLSLHTAVQAARKHLYIARQELDRIIAQVDAQIALPADPDALGG